MRPFIYKVKKLEQLRDLDTVVVDIDMGLYNTFDNQAFSLYGVKQISAPDLKDLKTLEEELNIDIQAGALFIALTKNRYRDKTDEEFKGQGNRRFLATLLRLNRNDGEVVINYNKLLLDDSILKDSVESVDKEDLYELRFS